MIEVVLDRPSDRFLKADGASHRRLAGGELGFLRGGVVGKIGLGECVRRNGATSREQHDRPDGQVAVNAHL